MSPTKMLMEDKRLFLVLSPEKALVFHKGSEERRATCGPERQRGLMHRLLGLAFGRTHALSQVMPHLSLAVLETERSGDITPGVCLRERAGASRTERPG